MTDKEIFLGLKNNDEKTIAWFYNHCYPKFVTYFRTKYYKTDDYISDLYQDSHLALWNNIQTGKLSVDTLSTSMYNYLLGVAINILKATDRRTKELFRVNMFYKDEESGDETLDKSVSEQIRFESEHYEDDIKYLELQDSIDSVVTTMPNPCHDLLRLFYWNRMNCNEIAKAMNYSNADSVKTQKNKCMKKLKSVVEKMRNI